MEDLAYRFFGIFVSLSFLFGAVGFIHAMLTGDWRGLIATAWAIFLFKAMTNVRY